MDLVEEAIEIIKECRATHTEWADWQEQTPDWEDQTPPSKVGDAEHHREWERKYDLVLEALRL